LSLKVFHLIFISISTILAFGFGWWALRFYSVEAKPLYLILGILSFIFGVALIVYEIIFIKKTKDIHF